MAKNQPIHNILGEGTAYYPSYCCAKTQKKLLDELVRVLKTAPFFAPLMPHTGARWSITMSNCGVLGWVADKSGYRYQKTHPDTGSAWPPIPPVLMKLWRDVANYAAPPQACLINYYDTPRAKMGLHQDRDEANFAAPVVSVSLGDSALFRMGGKSRKGVTQSLKLHSGDVFVFGGKKRLCFHGIDKILFGSSRLLQTHKSPLFAKGGRLNLTLRRVQKP